MRLKRQNMLRTRRGGSRWSSAEERDQLRSSPGERGEIMRAALGLEDAELDSEVSAPLDEMAEYQALRPDLLVYKLRRGFKSRSKRP